MAYIVSGTDLTAVANAIRTKGGTSASLSFPDGFVTAVGNISTGGSTLITKTISSNGTYNASSDSADGYSSVTVNVPTKLVTGTFTGTTAGSAMSISIPYTGSGYPVACMVYPSHGTYKSGDTFASLIQRYAEIAFFMIKNNIDIAPTYNDTSAEANRCTVLGAYKSSTSDPSTASVSSLNFTYAVFRSNAASDGSATCVRFNSNTSMSVYIADASYGFAKDIEYTYQVIYSS